ncbi:hypothetical protein IWX90DRAFT_320920 [Phyllosticta citrichinensis]|uniref:Uncharacterized protein n=1 Tax=Phyllosticta citrichinensis TaxID=1130410 RepID=A0ABR1XJV2_9PEZI
MRRGRACPRQPRGERVEGERRGWRLVDGVESSRVDWQQLRWAGGGRAGGRGGSGSSGLGRDSSWRTMETRCDDERKGLGGWCAVRGVRLRLRLRARTDLGVTDGSGQGQGQVQGGSGRAASLDLSPSLPLSRPTNRPEASNLGQDQTAIKPRCPHFARCPRAELPVAQESWRLETGRRPLSSQDSNDDNKTSKNKILDKRTSSRAHYYNTNKPHHPLCSRKGGIPNRPLAGESLLRGTHGTVRTNVRTTTITTTTPPSPAYSPSSPFDASSLARPFGSSAGVCANHRR